MLLLWVYAPFSSISDYKLHLWQINIVLINFLQIRQNQRKIRKRETCVLRRQQKIVDLMVMRMIVKSFPIIIILIITVKDIVSVIYVNAQLGLTELDKEHPSSIAIYIQLTQFTDHECTCTLTLTLLVGCLSSHHSCPWIQTFVAST